MAKKTKKKKKKGSGQEREQVEAVINRENKPIQLSQEALARLFPIAINDIEQAIKGRRTADKKLETYWKLYQPDPGRKNTPFKNACNIVPPVTTIVIDGLHTQEYQAVTGYEPRIMSEPIGNSDFITAAMGEKILNFYANKIKLDQTDDQMILNKNVEGTAIYKVLWERKEKKVRVRDEQGNKHWVIIQAKNQPKIELVNLVDFYCELDKYELDDSCFCAQRLNWSWYKLNEEKSKGRISKEGYNKLIEQKRGGTEKTEYVKLKEKLESVDEQPLDDQKRTNYQLFEYWCYFSEKDNELPSVWVLLFEKDSKILLKAQPSTYDHNLYPYVAFKGLPVPNRFLGISWVNKIKQVQDEITASHRQRVDNRTVANSKWFSIRRGQEVDVESIRPAAKVVVNDHDDIKERQFGDNLSMSIEEEHLLMGFIEKLTALSSWKLGLPSKTDYRAPAAKVIALIQEGDVYFSKYIKRTYAQYEKVVFLMKELIRQYATTDELSQILEVPADYLLAHPIFTINDKYNYKLFASTIAMNKTTEQRKQQYIYDMLMANPLVQNYPQRLYYNTRALLKAYDIHDITKRIGTEEQAEALGEQMRAQQAGADDEGQAGDESIAANIPENI